MGLLVIDKLVSYYIRDAIVTRLSLTNKNKSIKIIVTAKPKLKIKFYDIIHI